MDRVQAHPFNAHAVSEIVKGAASTYSDPAARMDMVAKLLDSAFVLPGTKRTVGIDAVIGLIPGVGDVITTLLSSYIIWEARNLGLPKRKIARMLANLAVHASVGLIPVAGDAFDAFFKVNQRNMRIVHRHLARAA